MTDTVYWTGTSGKKYEMQLCDFGATFNKISGVYIFCKPADNNMWRQIYVGECENFDDRLNINLNQHHRIDCIKREGATKVCAIVVSGDKKIRLTVETDLRKSLDPPCNRQ